MLRDSAIVMRLDKVRLGSLRHADRDAIHSGWVQVDSAGEWVLKLLRFEKVVTAHFSHDVLMGLVAFIVG